MSAETPTCTSLQTASPGSGRADLESVLSAWHFATQRLQRTHEVLGEEVRRLTRELEAKNRELARKNRLADLGQMASHVAHEVRNSLVPMTLYLSLLRRRLDGDAGGRAIMDKIDSGFIALEVTVNDLLNFTSQRDPVWRYFALRELVEEVCQSLSPQLAAQAIHTDLDIPQGLTVCADRNMIRRLVLNLVLNAVDAMPDGGDLVITAVQGTTGIELEVADSGPGIDDELRERILEPFFTTKSGGTGLGLAIVDRIIQAHGGCLRVDNCPEGGAAFTITIPTQVREAAA